MASWIGMEARSFSAAAFSGEPITVRPSIEPGADEAVLVVYGSNGSEVQRRQISATADAVEWDGMLDNGNQAPDGNYSFKVESMALGDIIGTSPAETYARITEARVENGETVFVLDSGAKVSAPDVSALREARL
jgi:flagellar basal-body rod modification protein FlgD